jgi:ABC-type amino acid transport substrate-binding protein
MKRLLTAVICVALCGASLPGRAEVVLDNILKSGTLKLGYREQSPPFSFLGPDQRPQGYSIDLCKSVASEIARKIGQRALEIKWVAVDANNRFDALKKGDIDLLCGNTTQTLARRAEFDFSLMTFVDGAGLLYRRGEQPKTEQDMRGLRFVVVEGTTTEATLDKLVASSRLGAQLLRARDHDAALATLREKRAEAYAADRTVLIATALKEGGQYELSPAQFNYEPYGLAFRRDTDLRLLIDRTLARLYRNGEIEMIMGHWFAQIGHLTPALEAMIQLNALPE